MSDKINNIVENLKSLTLLEAAELIKHIEESFNVDVSSVPTASALAVPFQSDNDNSEKSEEKTEFNVILEEVPSSKKITILKVVRSITSLGLKEAKELVESTPKILKESASKEDAEDIKSKLEEVGAKVSIK
uniref:Large ribosomal subunit protein bL12c n=1 Tax=Platysiphonia delicata TaxID=2006979 RepID=A0A1Z1M1M3_9FLOR|nr:ribosomal protein L12 [Platysiphonia delicata]ARW59673.1 ribosomal protein L12 [Platysiphonia delicata]